LHRLLWSAAAACGWLASHPEALMYFGVAGEADKGDSFPSFLKRVKYQ
jgi:hypothetical protein